MGIVEILLIAIGLSMDAFAVAVCKGLATRKLCLKHYLIVGAWFGGFQGLMPAIGFLLGSTFEKYITAFDHWVAFAALAIIGANMIKEALEKEDGCECCCNDKNASFAFKTMIGLAIATSIDALAIGVAFAVKGANIYFAAPAIAIITFVLSGVGLLVGNVFGSKYKSRAEFVGGLILILRGLKSLLDSDGLGLLNF